MAKAAVTRSIRDDHQKNFLKIFNGLRQPRIAARRTTKPHLVYAAFLNRCVVYAPPDSADEPVV